MIICVGLGSIFNRLLTVGIKSSATVQQIHPLDNSTIFSAGQLGIAHDFNISPSTPTSPNSLTIIAIFLSIFFSIIFFIKVVLPEPRNPVMTVTGVF